MRKQEGQALVVLLIIMIIGITITSASAAIVLSNTQGASRFEQGIEAYYLAEAGMEDTLLQLLRNPNYTGGVLNIGPGKATVQVMPGTPITIVSQGVSGNYQRIIQVKAVYNNNILTINSWKEI